MTTIPATSDNFAQHLILIRRHLKGLEAEIDRLEAAMHQRQQPRPAVIPGVTGQTKPDGERAAQLQRVRELATWPHELKIDTSTLSDDEIADIRRRYVDIISH